jgi:hypothetical protein
MAFLTARYGEREQWALAASTPYPHAAGNPPIPSQGLHWEWVTGDEWDVVTPNPVVDEYLAGGDPVWLASRETWPSQTRPNDPRWMMRRTYGESVQDVPASAGGHIILNDPAYVLADIAAKRRIVGWCAEVIDDRDLSGYGQHGALKDDPDALAVTLAMETLRLLAAPFDEHPDFDLAWQVTQSGTNVDTGRPGR